MACQRSRISGTFGYGMPASSQCQHIGATWPFGVRPCSGVA